MQVLLNIKEEGFDQESSYPVPHIESVISFSAATKQPQDSNLHFQLLHKVLFTNIFFFAHDHL